MSSAQRAHATRPELATFARASRADTILSRNVAKVMQRLESTARRPRGNFSRRPPPTLPLAATWCPHAACAGMALAARGPDVLDQTVAFLAKREGIDKVHRVALCPARSSRGVTRTSAAACSLRWFQQPSHCLCSHPRSPQAVCCFSFLFCRL